MEFGGWYNNPDAGGKNMRWWGNYGWTNGEDPTGGRGPNSSPSQNSGGGGSSGGGGAASRPAIPAFNFDYAGEAAKAFGELGPYYDKLLTDYKGDMNKILSRLIEDYDNGIRIKTR